MPGDFLSLSRFTRFNLLHLARAIISPGLGGFIMRPTQVRRNLQGSQYFTWNMPALAASGVDSIYIKDQFPLARKYKPLDWLEIQNNETVCDLLVEIGDEQFPVVAKTTRTITGKPLHNIKVTNRGDITTTLYDVILTMRKLPERV